MPRRPNNFTINRNHPLAKGLVFAGLGAHAGSTRYHDSSVLGNTGTLTNMDPATDWVWDSTLNRTVLDFDGGNDYTLIHTTAPAVFPVSAPISISAWVAADNWAAALALININSKFSIGFNSGIGMRDHVAGLTASRSTGFGAGTLHHIVGMSDGTTASIWTDGVQYTGGSSYVTPQAGTLIGARNSGTPALFFNGFIADACVYSRVLSSAEIQQLADPSNVMLSGLLQPPSRKWWPVVTAAPASTARNLILGGGVL